MCGRSASSQLGSRREIMVLVMLFETATQLSNVVTVSRLLLQIGWWDH